MTLEIQVLSPKTSECPLIRPEGVITDPDMAGFARWPEGADCAAGLEMEEGSLSCGRRGCQWCSLFACGFWLREADFGLLASELWEGNVFQQPYRPILLPGGLSLLGCSLGMKRSWRWSRDGTVMGPVSSWRSPWAPSFPHVGTQWGDASVDQVASSDIDLPVPWPWASAPRVLRTQDLWLMSPHPWCPLEAPRLSKTRYYLRLRTRLRRLIQPNVSAAPPWALM